MALLCSRVIFQTSRRNLYTTIKTLGKDAEPPVEKITGLQKRELLAEAAGIDDPFDLNVVKRDRVSTKDSPYEVPSAFEKRLVGCICQEDATSVSWMWLYNGAPRRCGCGHWFKLVQKNPL